LKLNKKTTGKIIKLENPKYNLVAYNLPIVYLLIWLVV